MSDDRDTALKEMLVEAAVVAREDLDRAAAEQAGSGENLGAILERMGATTADAVAALVSQKTGLRFITLSDRTIPHDAIDSIPSDIAAKYRVVPVERDGDMLTVAFEHPLNVFAADELRPLTGLSITPVLTYASEIDQAIQRHATT